MGAPAPTAEPAPAASWQVQLSAAKAEALKHYPRVSLGNVLAVPANEMYTGKWSYDEPFRMTFSFETPLQEQISVHFSDHDPLSTTKSVKNAARMPPAPSGDVYAGVSVSAREAGLVTWPEAQEAAEKQNTPLSPTIMLETEGSVPVWSVLYTAIDLSSNFFITFTVDARTGEIINQE